MQITYLGKADIYLIDEKDLIDDIVKDGEVEVGEKDKI